MGGVGESPKSCSSSLSAKVSAHERRSASSSPVVTIVSAQLSMEKYTYNIINGKTVLYGLYSVSILIY